MESQESKFRIEYPEGDELLGRISAIFAKNGGSKEIDHLRWQYVDNYGGGAYSAFAVSETGDDAAVYSLFKVRARFEGKEVVACQSLDTLTDKDYRGKGLFSILAASVNERCDAEDVSFIYGFPNDKSGPGFFKKLQWESLGFPPFMLRVNNIGYLLKRLMGWNVRVPSIVSQSLQYILNFSRKKIGNYEVREGSGFISDYDAIWTSFSKGVENTVIRDAGYLRWRYLSRPGSEYQYISIYRGDQLCATTIYALRDKHDGRVGYIMDVVFSSGHERAGSLAVGEALRALCSSDVDIILAWAPKCSKTRGSYLANLFFSLPRKLQPIKLFVGMRRCPPSGRLDGHELFLSYADSDTV
ncbi:GNAT family N-acetyltransferase [Rhodanobacter glycinis]|uniref:GNAT family N-acetyltransferase n=1 Tax=Rhodanobacter glycinis TaxID=582702 RepID=A0A5B9E4U5_9GAMM|nr:GNAT family N-acetyltransferase [Rhodanobacter glycinis]QEE25640.1 GNAT family N-acetyltransferase [Rhodanobacter glycinis]